MARMILQSLISASGYSSISSMALNVFQQHMIRTFEEVEDFEVECAGGSVHGKKTIKGNPIGLPMLNGQEMIPMLNGHAFAQLSLVACALWMQKIWMGCARSNRCGRLEVEAVRKEGSAPFIKTYPLKTKSFYSSDLCRFAAFLSITIFPVVSIFNFVLSEHFAFRHRLSKGKPKLFH